MVELGSKSEFAEEKNYQLTIDNERYLMIHNQSRYFLISDHCGHFGVSLLEGEIINDTIVCPVHGISFSLYSGEIVNRPWETCDAVKTYQIIDKNGKLFADLTKEEK